MPYSLPIGLEARAIDGFIPGGTSVEETRKLRNEATKLHAVKRTLQDRIRDEYEAAYHENSDSATSKQPAAIRARAEQRKKLYATEKDKVVMSRVSDDAEFATPR